MTAGDNDRRAAREKKTVKAMIELYCAAHHRVPRTLCPDCAEMLEYSHKRINACPLKTDKPTCLNCRIHCYNDVYRERIRAVMRYSGPRMMYRHPILAMHHIIDGRKGMDGRK